MVWLALPGSAELVQDTVLAVEAVQAEGLFNAFTTEGPSCFRCCSL